MLPQLHEYEMGSRVVAFSTTRHGGVGEGQYASFNVNHYCGDNPESVALNRRALCLLLQIDESHLVYPHQTHGTGLLIINNEFFLLPEDARRERLEAIDGVMTSVPGVCVGVSTADCIPLLLYDEVHHAVAAVHAGWRGTLARIAVKAVEAMRQTYGTCPAQLHAVIGPGISLKNFEVGDELFSAFAEAGFDMEDIARREYKWHIDLWECNRRQLLEQGVEAANIHVAGICTYDSNADFFSARRQGVQSGRILSAIMLRKRS